MTRLKEIKHFPRAHSGKGFEKAFKNRMIKDGYDVLRVENKNLLPDFLVKGSYDTLYFYECKNYRTYTDIEKAFNAWVDKQERQATAFFTMAAKGFRVYVVFNLKDKAYEVEL